MKKRNVRLRDRTIRPNVVYLVHSCPQGKFCRNPAAEVSFQKHDHLQACYKKKKELDEEVIYRRNMDPGAYYTERERAMFAFMKLIVKRNTAISAVEDVFYRNLSGFEHDFARATFKELMFTLVELIEDRITAEMKSTKGAIMYDGWTHGGMHYLGLFAIYVSNRTPNNSNHRCCR